jgi:hypothetical protein
MSADSIAGLLLKVAGLYAGAGLLFAVPFLLRGVERIDPAARGATPGFRLIVLPGVVALWPILLRRWIAGAPPPRERNAHRDAAGSGS